LYTEPDFVNVKSLLEEHCEKRGFKVLFLPKFHCEINPLEMVWGRSKYHYRLKPPSTKEEDLEANMIASLEAVTIEEMRR
jgi:transposase